MQHVLSEVEAKRVATAVLCRKHGVASLDLFGSATSDTWNSETSDLDFLVSFDPCAPGSIAERYLRLAEDLETLFGRPVDLITDRAIRNPYFRQNVDSSRINLYAT